MAKFTKGNNPNRRRHYRRPDLNERMIMATKAMLIDKKLGYQIPAETYEEMYKLKGEQK